MCSFKLFKTVYTSSFAICTVWTSSSSWILIWCCENCTHLTFDVQLTWTYLKPIPVTWEHPFLHKQSWLVNRHHQERLLSAEMSCEVRQHHVSHLWYLLKTAIVTAPMCAGWLLVLLVIVDRVLKRCALHNNRSAIASAVSRPSSFA